MSRPGWLLVALLACGCGSTTAPSTDDWPWHNLSVSGTVSLAGQSQLSGDTVQVRLTFRNQGSTAARVEFGVCAFGVQGVGRHGAEWDNHPAPNVSCANFGLVVDLKPGESRDIPVYRATASHIRESVPRDYYNISILVREAGVLRRFRAGGLEL
ncbi:MAG TPA: hypothetical protein VGP87_00925 [Gemmatimonadales bacterium]|nr:hypothetical protein [Gemmatimonadales bacterium]